MRYLFMTDWFYEQKNIGVKIKSPVELMVGMQKVIPSVFKKQNQVIYLQKMMGQILLYPVNVAINRPPLVVFLFRLALLLLLYQPIPCKLLFHPH